MIGRGHRKGKDGIPIDENGFVPLDALVSRYQEVGVHRDSFSTDSKVLPAKVTPEQVSDWWNDPSVCDVEGIDTADSTIYSVPFSIRGRKRKALRRIAFIGDRKESDRIKRILADSFTAEELELMASGISVVISSEPHLRDCTGYYLRRQEGITVPRIVLEQGTTADGIVHEAVHHLRVKDGRTAFPTMGGVMDSRFRDLPKAEKEKVVSREESETVAETVARTRVDPMESGYYERVPGMTSRSAYLYDQEVISGSKALKGKAAIKAAQRNYDRTTISRAIISGNRKKVGR